MTAWDVVGIGGAVFLATLTQQVSGFGFALLAVPLMSILVGPKQAVVIAFVAGFASSGMMSARLRDRIEHPVLRRILVGAVIGLPLGVFGLRELPEDPLRIALAIVVLTMVVVLASGYHFRSERPRTELAAGFVSGVLNGSLGTGGPPIVIVLQAADMEQHAFRATTTAFFAVCDLLAIPLLVASGVAAAATWWVSVGTIPIVVIGNAVGERIAFRVGRDRFRHLVLALLALSAVGAVAAVFT